jgi:tetratricopeptide (TPR) repeat protein
MFELLLQADKSLAAGALVQAERTYWQLVDLDPSNAMALAGLARVALARGDQRLSQDFAERALRIDPENVAARRVLDVLEHGEVAPDLFDSHAQQLIAARSLEGLGRGHKADSAQIRIASEDGDELDGPMPAPAVVETVPEAAARPVRARNEPHHAMPLGRRYFEPEALKVPLADQFAKAEMAAAVEAVEAAEVVDDVDRTAPEGRPTRVETGNTAETLEAIEATEADESVAMRIALISDASIPDAAERADDASGDSEATEAAIAEAGEATAMRIALLKGAAGLGAAEAEVEADEAAQEAIDEFEAAEFLAGHQAAQEGRAALAAVEAARLKWEAIPEVAAAPPRGYARADDMEASGAEAEAEARALREALAVAPGSQDGAAAAGASRGETPHEAEAPSGAPGKQKGLFRRFRGK